MKNNQDPQPDKLSKGEEREIVLLRTKLEIRTWILRFSIALNAFFIANTLWKTH